MTTSAPVGNLVAYHPHPGKEDALLAIVKQHYGVLRQLGLATDQPARIWTARDLDREHRGDLPVYFLEEFAWVDDKASDVAHQTPEVMAVWETMGPLLAKLAITKISPVV